MYKFILLNIFLLIPIALFAQNKKDIIQNILVLTSVQNEEELNEETIEHYEYLLLHPIKINLANRVDLEHTELFSSYQIASLLHYRQRKGDILSYTELSLIDGFNMDYVNIIKPFINLYSSIKVGYIENNYSQGKLYIKGSYTNKGLGEGLKFNYNYRDKMQLNIAMINKNTMQVFPPQNTTLSFAHQSKGVLSNIIIGDFNAKFGQGLSLWSGFALNSLGQANSFYRRPSGLTASTSYSTLNFRGIATTYNIGSYIVSAACASSFIKELTTKHNTKTYNIMPIFNITKYFQNGQLSFTSYSNIYKEYKGRVGIDFTYNWNGVLSYGELCWDFNNIAGIIGCKLPINTTNNVSFQLRYYPSKFYASYSNPMSYASKPINECALILGWEGFNWVFVGQIIRNYSKKINVYKLLVTKNFKLNNHLTFKLKASNTLSYKQHKEDIRLDIVYDNFSLYYAHRIEATFAKGYGIMSYGDIGYRKNWHKLYVKACVFKIDRWENRIYVYQRQAPGTLSIPALWGKGYNISLNYSVRVGNLNFYVCSGGVFYFTPQPTELLCQLYLIWTLK